MCRRVRACVRARAFVRKGPGLSLRLSEPRASALDGRALPRLAGAQGTRLPLRPSALSGYLWKVFSLNKPNGIVREQGSGLVGARLPLGPSGAVRACPLTSSVSATLDTAQRARASTLSQMQCTGFDPRRGLLPAVRA